MEASRWLRKMKKVAALFGEVALATAGMRLTCHCAFSDHHRHSTDAQETLYRCLRAVHLFEVLNMRILLSVLAIGWASTFATRAGEAPVAEASDKTPISESDELYFQAEGILLPCARKYLEAFSSPDERRKWDRKMDDRIDTRIADGALGDRESIFQDLALDWAAGNEKKLRKRDHATIKEACFMFLRFIERRIHLPLQIRSRITMADCREIVREIDGMVAAKGKKE
jgi:hypothetical protein